MSSKVRSILIIQLQRCCW